MNPTRISLIRAAAAAAFLGICSPAKAADPDIAQAQADLAELGVPAPMSPKEWAPIPFLSEQLSSKTYYCRRKDLEEYVNKADPPDPDTEHRVLLYKLDGVDGQASPSGILQLTASLTEYQLVFNLSDKRVYVTRPGTNLRAIMTSNRPYLQDVVASVYRDQPDGVRWQITRLPERKLSAGSLAMRELAWLPKLRPLGDVCSPGIACDEVRTSRQMMLPQEHELLAALHVLNYSSIYDKTEANAELNADESAVFEAMPSLRQRKSAPMIKAVGALRERLLAFAQATLEQTPPSDHFTEFEASYLLVRAFDAGLADSGDFSAQLRDADADVVKRWRDELRWQLRKYLADAAVLQSHAAGIVDDRDKIIAAINERTKKTLAGEALSELEPPQSPQLVPAPTAPSDDQASGKTGDDDLRKEQTRKAIKSLEDQ